MGKQLIDEEYLKYLAIGAAVLGTGGGGDPRLGYLMAKQAIAQYGPVTLLSLDELDDKCNVASVSMMGAPSVALEKIQNGQEFVFAVKEMEKYQNGKVEALYPIEAGGLNSVIPIVAAAQLNIPLLDADCMGRAFPQLEMVTQSIFDISNTPFVVTNEKLESIIVDTPRPHDMEKYCRILTMSFGGSAITAEGYVPNKVFKIYAIQGIVSTAHEIGQIIDKSSNPIEDLISKVGAYHLFDGKISDILRTYEDGFNKGHIFISSFDNQNLYEIFLQNENLVAFKNKEVVAMVPDLICILDYQTKRPITTETLKFGQRISVIGFKSDERWRLPKGLELTGPRAFGYDFDYIPIEELGGK